MKKFRFSNKIIIAVNLFLIFTLMTVSVYSWFAAQVDNRVDSYEIEVEANEALELSFDKETWGGSLNLADLKVDTNKTLYNTLKFVEVTGDGSSFNKPQLDQHTNYASVNTNGEFTTAEKNKDYIEFTVYMRSKDTVDVYLSSDSKATPSAVDALTGEDCKNASTYATGADSFSKDCVVGALRTSFKNFNGDRQVWITNPEFHLNNKVGSPDYTMDINANATSYTEGTGASGSTFQWNNPKVHMYYNSSKTLVKSTPNTITELPDTVNVFPTSVTSTKLASLSGTADENGYHKSEATFTIWLEGCDTEARKALIGGSFNLSLVFDTYPVNN